MAILSISAHWFVPGTGLTIGTRPGPSTISGVFTRAVSGQYPAPGDPDLARRVQAMLAPLPVKLDNAWGLDHGAWSVLRHVYPDADIPVIQLSIDETQPPAFHFESAGSWRHCGTKASSSWAAATWSTICRLCVGTAHARALRLGHSL